MVDSTTVRVLLERPLLVEDDCDVPWGIRYEMDAKKQSRKENEKVLQRGELRFK